MTSDSQKSKSEILELTRNIAEKYGKKQVHLFLIDDKGFDYVFHKDHEHPLSDDSQKLVSAIENMYLDFVEPSAPDGSKE